MLRVSKVVFFAVLISVIFCSQIFSIEKEKRISIDLYQAEISDVLRMIGEQYNLNIIVSKGVEGKISLRLENVLLENALEVILEAVNCQMIKIGEIYKIVPKVTIEEIPPQKTVTEIYTPKFIKATDLKSSLLPLLTKVGKIDIFVRSSTGERDALIISDTSENVDRISKIIEKLDTDPGQVQIESKMLEASLEKLSDLGIDWDIMGEVTGSSRNTGFPFEGKGTTSGFTFGRLSFEELKVVLKALETQGNTNIISNAKVATINGRQAEILVGNEVPIRTFERAKETGTWGITGYQTESIGIKLSVTPCIIDKNLISMEIHPEVSEITGWVNDEIGGIPIKATREVTTNVIIEDGETIVIGGLLRESEVKEEKKVPFFGDLPVFGNLFKKKTASKQKTDLLIFITANIVKKSFESQTIETEKTEEKDKHILNNELKKFLEYK